MKNLVIPLFLTLLFLPLVSCQKADLGSKRNTHVSIQGGAFLINGNPTYQGRSWEGHKVEGLLMNARMVQGIFDDLNPETVELYQYPDTGVWDPERNTAEFIAAMPSLYEHGLLAFTLNLQGGSPTGYGSKDWINTLFDPTGEMRVEYLERLERILDAADQQGMVVILGLFYFGQDQYLEDETAVYNAVDHITDWLFQKQYRNVIIEVDNECSYPRYDHEILDVKGVHKLIEYVAAKQQNDYRFLVGTSFRGNEVPSDEVIAVSDFIMPHGNKVHEPSRIKEIIDLTRASSSYRGQPIVFNEDDHYDFDKPENNCAVAVRNYASWGYFDFRRKGEPFEEGFQSVPADWTISTERKREFFDYLNEITGGQATPLQHQYVGVRLARTRFTLSIESEFSTGAGKPRPYSSNM